MKRIYVLLSAILFISHLSYAGGPLPTEEPVVVHQPVESGTITIDRNAALQPIDRGEILYNGQLQTATQIGDTLYLPSVQKAYTIPDGYEPITLFNQVILFNPDTNDATDLNLNGGTTATMPVLDGTYLAPADGGISAPADGGISFPAGP